MRRRRRRGGLQLAQQERAVVIGTPRGRLRLLLAEDGELLEHVLEGRRRLLPRARLGRPAPPRRALYQQRRAPFSAVRGPRRARARRALQRDGAEAAVAPRGVQQVHGARAQGVLDRARRGEHAVVPRAREPHAQAALRHDDAVQELAELALPIVGQQPQLDATRGLPEGGDLGAHVRLERRLVEVGVRDGG